MTGETEDSPARPASAARPVAALRPGQLWRPAAGPGWGPLPELLLALTLVTGLVDAVSILALGRVFVANMTGNVVFAGFAIVGAPGFSLSSSLFALAGFLIGAAGGGWIGGRAGPDRAALLRAAAAAELALVAIALVVAATSGGYAASHGIAPFTVSSATTSPDGTFSGTGTFTGVTTGPAFGTVVTDVLALLLAVAMGIQNSAARKLSVPDLTTTVLTMTLTGIGADPRAGHRGHVTLVRRLLVVATMAAGAVLGAWLVLHVSATAALAVSTGGPRGTPPTGASRPRKNAQAPA